MDLFKVPIRVFLNNLRIQVINFNRLLKQTNSSKMETPFYRKQTHLKLKQIRSKLKIKFSNLLFNNSNSHKTFNSLNNKTEPILSTNKRFNRLLNSHLLTPSLPKNSLPNKTIKWQAASTWVNLIATRLNKMMDFLLRLVILRRGDIDFK